MPKLTLPVLAISALVLFVACSSDSITEPSSSISAGTINADLWGPETPPFNVQVLLRGDGFGLVKFRQPNDADQIVYLDIWVRDLLPNTTYLLQRAVDPIVDDNCTSGDWLTLGKGLVPQSITTDENGTAREQLFRSLAAFPAGTEFDIHFRLINEATPAVVLQSECYQFTISL